MADTAHGPIVQPPNCATGSDRVTALQAVAAIVSALPKGPYAP